MAQDRVPLPQFSGDDDEYCLWMIRADAYAVRYGFQATLTDAAEADLPAAQGPGAGADEIAAVERNAKAVSFLTTAMPDKLLVNIMAAGKGDPDWPTQAKAHLMIAYLKSSFEDTSTLSRVGAKRDLENCKMNKEDNPKGLFTKLVAVKYKYSGNRQANITESDIVTQAIQVLPSMYNSAVYGVLDAERRAGRDVSIEALQQAVVGFYGIAMKGRSPSKTKDIEGGLAAMDDPMQSQANIKKLIEDTIQSTMRDCNLNGNQGNGNQYQQPNFNGSGDPSASGESTSAERTSHFRKPNPIHIARI
jgi:gag-polypeptide of LTR copia-type